MKKIIGIILAMLMVFSMSTMAFAGYSAVPSVPSTDYVKAVVILTENSHEVYETHKVGDEVTEVKGTTVQFKVGLENYTETPILWSDVMDDFKVTAKFKNENGNVLVADEFYVTPKWLKGGDSLTNYINPNTAWGHDYGMKILSQRTLWYDITLGGITKTIKVTEGKVEFYLTLDKEVITTTGTTSTTVAPTETTEAPTEAPTVVTTTTTTTIVPVIDEPDNYEEPSYEAPEVDYEIPNTGSSKAIGGVVALGVIAAGALLLVRKRKSNEEQIG